MTISVLNQHQKF